eukprot:TRINITY_DN65574_c0_g1_i1.p1 TRINITY_DN65574_c0_g1~~TRINITY_DN65574_c0_g1_i1.p1  ORF type:complete len:291 (-),score=54.97 TRINITY_DN65574_c0_g1_i1:162-1034(-)
MANKKLTGKNSRQAIRVQPPRAVKKKFVKIKAAGRGSQATSKKANTSQNSAYERLPASLSRARGRGSVIGVDEAGRGPWAGPVVAAAVSVAQGARGLEKGITDSKKLNEAQRELVYELLVNSPHVSWSVSIVNRSRIDKINILEAAHEAMTYAVHGVQGKRKRQACGGKAIAKPASVLVDGNLLPKKLADLPCKPVVGGDRKNFEIAAASVLAKVTRDRLMAKMCSKFPQYGFGAHKGYGTASHQAALKRYGPCAEHRRSFEPVKTFLETGRWQGREVRQMNMKKKNSKK